MELDAALCEWLESLTGSGASSLGEYADGSMLVSIAQDVIPDYDFEQDADNAVATLAGALATVYERSLRDVEVSAAAASATEPSPTNVGHLSRLVQLLLAASMQCAKRSEYIECIMSLSDDAQTCIMEAIETVLQAAESDVPSSDETACASSPLQASSSMMSPAQLRALASPIGEFAARCVESKRLSLAGIAAGIAARDTTVSPGRGGGGLAHSRGPRSATKDPKRDLSSGLDSLSLKEEVGDLRHTIDKLRSENELLRARSEESQAALSRMTLTPAETAASLRKMEKSMEQQRISAEQEAQARAALRESDAQVRALTAKLGKATQELELAQKFKDEADLLRPVAAAKERTDIQLEKLRKKLEGVEELKGSLKRVEATNAELVTRMMDLEREAARVPVLQAKLDATKDEKSAAEVRISELESALSEANTSIEEYRLALRAESEKSTWGNAITSEPSSPSQARSAPRSRHSGGGPSEATLEDGIHEFNPEVAQRMARLERENAELRGSVDASSCGRLEELERSLDDTKRLKSVFESRYLAVKARVAELESELQASLKAHVATQAQLQDSTQQLAAEQTTSTTALAGAHSTISQLQASVEELSISERAHKATVKMLEHTVADLEASLAHSVASHQALEVKAAAELAKAHKEQEEALAGCERSHSAATRRLEQSLEEERGRCLAEKDALAASHASSLAHLKLSHGDALSSLQLEYRATVERMQTEHAVGMGALRAEYKETVEALSGEAAARARRAEEDFTSRFTSMQDGLMKRLREAEEEASLSAGSLRDKLTARIRELEDGHSEEVRRLRREHVEGVAALRADHVAALEEVVVDRDTRVGRLTREKEAECARLAAELAERVSEAERSRDARVAEATLQRETCVREWERKYAEDVGALQAQHVSELAALRGALTGELAQARVEAESAVADAVLAHEVDVRTLKEGAAEEMRKTLAKADFELNTTRRELSEQVRVLTAELKRVQTRLEHEVGSLEATLEMQKSDDAHALQELREEFATYKACHTVGSDEYESKASMAKKLIADARSEATALRAQLAEANTSRGELEAQINELQDQLDQLDLALQDKVDELENAHADMYSKDLRARMDSATTTGGSTSGGAVARPVASGVRSPKRDYKEIEELLEKINALSAMNETLMTERSDVSAQLAQTVHELKQSRAALADYIEACEAGSNAANASAVQPEEGTGAPKRATRSSLRAVSTTEATVAKTTARRVKTDPEVVRMQLQLAEMAEQLVLSEQRVATLEDEERRTDLAQVAEFTKPFDVEVAQQKLRLDNMRLRSQITHLRLLVERALKALEDCGMDTTEFSLELAAVEAAAMATSAAASAPSSTTKPSVPSHKPGTVNAGGGPSRSEGSVTPVPTHAAGSSSRYHAAMSASSGSGADTTADLLGLNSPPGGVTANFHDFLGAMSPVASDDNTSLASRTMDMSADGHDGAFTSPDGGKLGGHTGGTAVASSGSDRSFDRITSSFGTSISAARPTVGRTSLLGNGVGSRGSASAAAAAASVARPSLVFPNAPIMGRKSILSTGKQGAGLGVGTRLGRPTAHASGSSGPTSSDTSTGM